MKLQNATLVLEPRSVGACIDLAILYYRQHWRQLLGLTLVFGTFPVAIGVITAPGGAGWLWSGLLFFFVSSFLGAAVVAGAGHQVFGEPLTVTGALRHVYRNLPSLLFFLPTARIILGGLGLLCWGLLWVPAASRYGFLSEVLILEQLRGLRIGKRLEEILRNTWLEACGRYTAILVFAVCLSTALFLFLDLGSQLLFGVPVFVAKVSWAVASEDVFNLLSYDPVLIGVLSATWWAVYPLARLAWFFCYLDARIRKEGWDVELQFRVEATRLAHAQ